MGVVAHGSSCVGWARVPPHPELDCAGGTGDGAWFDAVDVVVQQLAQALPAGGRIPVVVPVGRLRPAPAVRVLATDVAQGAQDRVDSLPCADRLPLRSRRMVSRLTGSGSCMELVVAAMRAGVGRPASLKWMNSSATKSRLVPSGRSALLGIRSI